MRTKYISQVILVLSMVFGVAVPALAGKATEHIKQTTDRILSIVTDPALKTPAKSEERKKLIRKAVDERFDWEEFSRRALARHWKKRTDDEKREFIYLFGKLLERTYISKVESYSGEKVCYLGESIEGSYGVVKVQIVTKKDTVISVDYRVRKKRNDWFVYDVSIEGVSFVKNYRGQFNSILMKSTYQELVKRLKEKVAQE